MNFVLVDGKYFFESNEGTEGAFSCILDQKVTDGIFGDGQNFLHTIGWSSYSTATEGSIYWVVVYTGCIFLLE